MKREKEEIIKNSDEEYYNTLVNIVESDLIKYKVHIVINDTLTTLELEAHMCDYLDDIIEFHTYTGDILSGGRWMRERTPTTIFHKFDRDKVICVEIKK